MYTFIKNCEIVECDTLLEVASHFEILILENGQIRFNGKIDTISYKLDEWTPEEIKKDFVKTRLAKFVKIYKSERL
jgi:hypothetical protein